jgi:SlyX protein
MNQIEALEERIAHLTRAVEDLSDVVARQSRDLDRLLRLTQLLAEREAERESDGSGGIPLADQRPPHW